MPLGGQASDGHVCQASLPCSLGLSADGSHGEEEDVWVLAGTWERGSWAKGGLPTCRLGDPAPFYWREKIQYKQVSGHRSEMEAPRVSVLSPQGAGSPSPCLFAGCCYFAATKVNCL